MLEDILRYGCSQQTFVYCNGLQEFQAPLQNGAHVEALVVEGIVQSVWHVEVYGWLTMPVRNEVRAASAAGMDADLAALCALCNLFLAAST